MLNDRNFGVITRVRVKTPVERLQPSLHVVLGQQLQPATRRARERMSAFDAGAQTCLALRLPASELLPLQLNLLTLARHICCSCSVARSARMHNLNHII